MLQRFLSSEPTATEDGKYRFLISDESKDRYGTVIKANGWELDNYNRNAIVAYNHYTGGFNPDNIIGKSRVWVEGDKLWGEVELEPGNPVAEKVKRRLEFGTLRAASVGFNPLEWSDGDVTRGEERGTLYFRKHELLEWSIVDVPANPNAELQRNFTEFVRMAKEELAPVGDNIGDKDAPANSGPDEFITKLLTVKMLNV